MELIVTLLIVSLFGVWIFNLKHEMQDLRRRIPRHAYVAPRTVQEIAAVPVRAPSRDGVQTWILE